MPLPVNELPFESNMVLFEHWNRSIPTVAPVLLPITFVIRLWLEDIWIYSAVALDIVFPSLPVRSASPPSRVRLESVLLADCVRSTDPPLPALFRVIMFEMLFPKPLLIEIPAYFVWVVILSRVLL